ncbi:transposase [TM7 phylum sp. oral taxon 352]|jgi:transposase, IS605 OrfB family, central region|nr:transposase [TM7 phylum sp. oral taxon 352]
MLRAIKVRLYPNKTQEQPLNKVLGCYRFVYNHMLALKQKEYNENGKSLGVTELSKYFHGALLKDKQYAWLKEQNTKVMNQAIRQMDGAYQKFFKQHNGFPQFKTKKDKQTALFPLEAISKRNKFNDRKITLIKSLKDIKFRCSDLYFKRLQTYKEKIRSATLSKTKSGNYFLSILVEVPQEEVIKFRATNKHVGIDLGVKDFVITSDGEVFENRHFFKKQEVKIAKLQRQLSKKQKGSNNRSKQRVRMAKAFEKLTYQKDAYIHSVVNELLTYYDTIFMEDLNVQGMLKNHKLAKAIQEIGFYKFKQILVDKARNNYKQVVFVDKFYPSSKTCSYCGYKKQDLKLSDRFWVCPECGKHHDRDINAAINILHEGERIEKNRCP